MYDKIRLFFRHFGLLILFLSFLGCGKQGLDYSIEVEPNPHGIAPLTAYLHIKAEVPVQASVKVLGRIPVEKDFETISDSLLIPVLGLYPARRNRVEVHLKSEKGSIIDTVEVSTSPVPEIFPRIDIEKLDKDNMEPGMHGCDIHFANYGKFRSIPMIFDDRGTIRWYLDLSSYGSMLAPFQRLSDGNLLMVSRHQLHEFDMMGQPISETEIDNNYGMHHDVIEIPGDRLLICVGKRDAVIRLDNKLLISDSDFLILYDRKNGKVIKEWDMAKHLDVSRNDLNFFRPGDWLHMNGLAYDESDNSIIVSAKNQGLVKISWDDELRWIMSPHKNWGKAGRDGNGKETSPYLLTAVDDKGNPYSSAVQLGTQSDQVFDFPWGPHAPELLPNGNLLVFDNGTYRNFSDKNRYSRAVEYKVDEENNTVQEVWQYGKERGVDFYSSIVSDVDFLAESDHVLITSGYLYPRENHSAKIVEVDYKTKKEVFEATLYLKTVNGDGSVAGWGQTDILYRSERMELYD